jgi:hypothetical protein
MLWDKEKLATLIGSIILYFATNRMLTNTERYRTNNYIRSNNSLVAVAELRPNFWGGKWAGGAKKWASVWFQRTIQPNTYRKLVFFPELGGGAQPIWPPWSSATAWWYVVCRLSIIPCLWLATMWWCCALELLRGCRVTVRHQHFTLCSFVVNNICLWSFTIYPALKSWDYGLLAGVIGVPWV